MRRLLAALALSALLASGAAAKPRPVAVDLGEIETVALDKDGVARLTVQMEERGRLGFDVFAAPDAAGEIIVETLDDKGEPVPLGMPAGPGRVTAQVRAQNPLAARIQLRLRADPSLDLFEPNDKRGKAARVEPPFDGWIESGPGDEDWFVFNSPSKGVVGVKLEPPPYGEVLILDSQGESVYGSGERGVPYGIAYAPAEPGRMYVVVRGPPDNPSAPAVMSRLTIAHYRTPPRADGRVVTLGLEEDEVTRGQLDLAARAAGAEAVSASDADGVAAALTAAAAEPAPSNGAWRWIAAAVLAATVAAGGYYVWRRRRAR